MPETTRRNGKNGLLLVAGCLVAAVIILAVGFFTGSTTEFGGTDAAVVESIEEDGYEPWFNPVFSLESGELEAGLFGVQSAIGAGIVGFVLGSLRERRRANATTSSKGTPAA